MKKNNNILINSPAINIKGPINLNNYFNNNLDKINKINTIDFSSGIHSYNLLFQASDNINLGYMYGPQGLQGIGGPNGIDNFSIGITGPTGPNGPIIHGYTSDFTSPSIFEYNSSLKMKGKDLYLSVENPGEDPSYIKTTKYFTSYNVEGSIEFKFVIQLDSVNELEYNYDYGLLVGFINDVNYPNINIKNLITNRLNLFYNGIKIFKNDDIYTLYFNYFYPNPETHTYINDVDILTTLNNYDKIKITFLNKEINIYVNNIKVNTKKYEFVYFTDYVKGFISASNDTDKLTILHDFKFSIYNIKSNMADALLYEKYNLSNKTYAMYNNIITSLDDPILLFTLNLDAD